MRVEIMIDRNRDHDLHDNEKQDRPNSEVEKRQEVSFDDPIPTEKETPKEKGDE
jgi:hypothetical protein